MLGIPNVKHPFGRGYQRRKARVYVRVLPGILMAGMVFAQSWISQESGTKSSLRGVSAASQSVVWASGTAGTYLRTVDGGATWRAAVVPGAADVDFRAVRAFDDRSAILMSAGEGAKSRIYRTTDGGAQWFAVYTNPDPKGFFDAMAFWDESHGILLGDPVDGRFVIQTTDDGGVNWKKQKGPGARTSEAAFAASNSSLVVRGTHEVWFGTGGSGGGRVFHSEDGGKTWSSATAPIRNDSGNAGIFSLAFSSSLGIAIGGDYTKPSEKERNIAISTDTGKTWTTPAGSSRPMDAPPGGYRSAVAYVADRKMWIATGTTGSDISYDGGKTWKQFDSGAYNALSFISGSAATSSAPAASAGWAVGPNGAIARFKIE